MHGQVQHQTRGIPPLRGNPHTAITSFETLKETPVTQRLLKPGFAAAKGKLNPFTQHRFILTSLYAYILL